MFPTRPYRKACRASPSVKHIKSASSAINTGASSSLIHSKFSVANRLSKVRILKDGEAASIKYFTNALGQQVFHRPFSVEPKPDQYLSEQSELGTGFIAWLKTNFGWLYAQAQTDASLGSAYMYADGQLPSWAVLGEYDNGSASGTGRTEYLWLPTEDGGAVPVGMFRSGKFFAIHSDHLGTPRLMTDSTNKAVWQWPYSAFGNNKPTGVLKPTTSATGAFANQPNLLATQNPAVVLDLRFPGQMADVETGLFYNYFRTYQPSQGRYTQNDPIGLDGGLNRFGYVGGNALSFTDPYGLFELPSFPEPFVDFWRGYGSYYGGLGNAASHMWRRAGAEGDCEKQRAVEDEALLAAALLSLSDPRISKPALAAAQNWANNHKSYLGGRLSAGVVTSGATGVGVYGGISMGTTAAMGDALRNVSRGADNPKQVLRSILGDKMPNLPNNSNRTQCGCRK